MWVVGEEELVHAAGVDVVREGNLGATEQGLAEAAQLEEIEILLAFQQVRVRDFAGIEHLVRIGLAEVLETVAGCMRGEFVEPDGVIDGGEIVVEEDVVFLLEESGGFRVGQLREQAAGFGEERGGILNAAGVAEEDFAEHAARVAAWVGVVADEGDAVRREALTAEGEQGVADFGWDPGVEAVGEDVVEFRKAGCEIAEVGGTEFEVPEFEIAGGATSSVDGIRGEIDAVEVAVREVVGEGDHIPAGAAADLEYAAAIDGGGGHAEQGGDRRQAVGMGLAARESPVGNLVVTV